MPLVDPWWVISRIENCFLGQKRLNVIISVTFLHLKGNCHHFQYHNGRKYWKNPDEQKKRNLKAVFLQPQWLVKDLQLQADDVTGAKKPFYHTNPYIID